jgi:hypothetical protein
VSLTNEDKEWLQAELGATLGRVESNVAASVKDLESRLSTLIFDVAASVRDLESRLTAKFSADLEAMETKLLTEFHKWASPTEMRLRSHSLVMHALDLDIGNLKEPKEKIKPTNPPQ